MRQCWKQPAVVWGLRATVLSCRTLLGFQRWTFSKGRPVAQCKNNKFQSGGICLNQRISKLTFWGIALASCEQQSQLECAWNAHHSTSLSEWFQFDSGFVLAFCLCHWTPPLISIGERPSWVAAADSPCLYSVYSMRVWFSHWFCLSLSFVQQAKGDSKCPNCTFHSA